jgi:hypothetical protein
MPLVGKSTNGGFGSFAHLAARFFGALDPRGPSPADETWATDHLVPGEVALWNRMSGPDRRHAVGVARDTIVLLAPDPPRREVIAAALLHDVGKVESGFGTFSRVAVTVLAMVVGRSRLVGRETPRQTRVAKYLTHDRLGADLLRQAGSDDLTVAWAEEHHLDAQLWTVDPQLGMALKAADGD